MRRLDTILPPGILRGTVAAMAGPQAVGFRVNSLKATVDKVLAGLPVDAEPLPWLPGAFVVPAGHRQPLLDSDAFATGAIWIQNPSSMIPPVVLAPEAGESVLDLAAAPGSKTLQIACAMGPGADIAAVEVARPRFYRLKRNLRAQGAAWVKTFHRDGVTVPRYRADHFDRVLIDAPCSTEAQMRPDDPASFAHWSEKKVRTMAGKQRRLLEAAVRCARPGGVIVYSTCSFAPEENEMVVQHVLECFGDEVAIEPIALDIPGRLPGLPGWKDAEFDGSLSRAMRVLPDGVYEAFFVCRLRKR